MEVIEIKRRGNFENKLIVNNRSSEWGRLRLRLKNTHWIWILCLVTSKSAVSGESIKEVVSDALPSSTEGAESEVGQENGYKEMKEMKTISEDKLKKSVLYRKKRQKKLK